MKVLVTGGTGVVGTAAVRALLAAGHPVRLFSRNAAEDAARWQENVEARPGSVASVTDMNGAAEGCEAILHIAGIAEETPPDATFERVNVDGTRNVLLEAERAGVSRLVYVSSLGAERGRSGYHKSKYQAEQIVRAFSRDWLLCRPGNVYGPGDEVLSFLLRTVRTAPAVPVIDGGDQPFQPLWAEDLGAALALAVERQDLSRQVLLLAGPEVTTTQDLLDRLARLTGKDPVRIPVPSVLAGLGAQVASLVGVRVPVDQNKVDMLLEENVIQPGEVNALTDVLGVRATPLEEGLARLANEQPEQLPGEGVGTLMRRIYHAPLEGLLRSPAELFEEFRSHFFEIVPESTMGPASEPAAEYRLEPGATLTLSLPMRGHVQVRVVEMTETSMTVVTVAGHPLAGSVTFRVAGNPGDDLRFEVETCDRPATLPDSLMMSPLGTLMKRANWMAVVERTIDALGALPSEMRTFEQPLTDDEARRFEADLRRRIDNLARTVEPELQEEAKEKLETAGKP